MPKATKIPKTCTGGIGVKAREAKPAEDVREVYNMGMNSWSMTCSTVLRLSPIF